MPGLTAKPKIVKARNIGVNVKEKMKSILLYLTQPLCGLAYLQRPNIICIIRNNMGYDDLVCYAQKNLVSKTWTNWLANALKCTRLIVPEVSGRNFINANYLIESIMVLKQMKLIAIVCLLAMPPRMYSQDIGTCLPQLQFAEVVNKTMFLGDRWSFMEQGSKNNPVIIALHGAGGNSMSWHFQLSGLSKKFRVIAWNAPGYMLSDGFKTETPGCEDYANALLDFMTALRLDSVYLVGNSFGSRVCQCFAIQYPQKVIKMALIGPSAFQVNVPDSIKNKIIQARIEQIKEGGYAFGSRRVNATVGKNASQELIKTIGENMKATNKRAFLQATTYLVFAEGYSPTDVAAKIKKPVLIVAGEDDTVSPIDKNAALLKRALSKSELVTLKDIGHVPHLEAPAVVNDLIQKFFLKKE